MSPYLHRSQVWKWRTSQRPYLEQQHAVAPHITASTELLVKEALSRRNKTQAHTETMHEVATGEELQDVCLAHTPNNAHLWSRPPDGDFSPHGHVVVGLHILGHPKVSNLPSQDVGS